MVRSSSRRRARRGRGGVATVRARAGLAWLAATGVLAGCAGAAATHSTAAAQAEAAGAIQRAYRDDLALLRSQIAAHLEIRRTVVAGGLHRELIELGYLTPMMEADLSAFDRDLRDRGSASALVEEVRAGRRSAEACAAWLRDYALAHRFSDGARVADGLLGGLGPLQTHDAAAAALLGAFDEHASDVEALLGELVENAGVLLASSVGPGPAVSPGLWRRITSRIGDPSLRAAAEALAGELVTGVADAPGGPEPAAG